MPSTSLQTPELDTTEAQVLGVTGQTVVYVFPSGTAQALRDKDLANNLVDVNNRPKPKVHKLLGERLIEAGLITNVQINVALHDQQATGMLFGEILIMRGWLNESQLSAFV